MNSTAFLNWNPALLLTVGHLVAPQPTLSVLCQTIYTIQRVVANMLEYTTYTVQKEDDDMFYYSLASFLGPM